MAGFNPHAAAGVPTPTFNVGNALMSGLRGVKNFLDNPLVRKAAGAYEQEPGPYDAWLNQPVNRTPLGPPVPDRLKRAPQEPPLSTLGGTPVPPAPGRPAPIVQASDDTYKALLSQYGGAPGIQQLAGMTSLPTAFTPTGATQAASLKDYYGAQQLQGSANLGTIINALGYTGDMAKWAQANPALAQREYAKKFGMNAAGANPVAGFTMPQQLAGQIPAAYQGEPAGQVFSSPKPPVNPMQGFGLNQQLVSATSPQTDYSFKFGAENFGNPVNSVPAPPADTQAMLKVPFNQAMEIAKQRQNPQNAPFSSFYNPTGN